MEQSETSLIFHKLNNAFIENKPLECGSKIIKSSFQKELHLILEDTARRICYPKVNPDYDDDHNLCVTGLFEELELFICNGKPTSEVFKELESQGTSVLVSSVCGHLFKSREPTYTCEDCAMDPTCVFCRSCFLQSAHVKHNYRMHSSNGGGYCDCGDVEAWHRDPWCKVHLAAKERNERLNSSISDSQDLDGNKSLDDEEQAELERINQIPAYMRERADALMEFLIEWATNLILYKKKSRLPESFNIMQEDDCVCVLFNDELHSYDQVIRALSKYVPDCTKQSATNFATIVDRDGRSVIHFGTEQVTREIASKVQEHTLRQTGSILKCKSIQSHLLSLQNFSLHIIQWLVDLVSKLEILRPLVCRWLFQVLPLWENSHLSNNEGQSVLERLFLSHAKLWKGARRIILNFFMGVILKDGYYKKKFAQLYTQHYSDLIDAYANDDHHDIDSLKLITCQIYTVMSLARQLLESHSILHNIVEAFLDEVHNHLKPLEFCPTEHVLNYSQPQRSKFDRFQRYFDCFGDMKYVLLNLKNDDIWCKSQLARKNYLDYFGGLVLLLRYVQDMNLMTRSAEDHVEEEPEWTTGFFVTISMCPVIRLSPSVAASDPDLLYEAFIKLWDVYKSRVLDYDKKYLSTVKAFNKSWSIVDLNVSIVPVTVIQPLPRMVCAFYECGLRYNFTWSHYRIQKEEELILMLERPLQVLVYCSQVSRNHWVRNGIATQNIISNLFRPSFRTEMVDRDYQFIQQIASKLSPDKFLVCMYNKFNLHEYFVKESLGDRSDSVRFLSQSAEDFFRLLLVTISERHRIGVGEGITMQEILKREIIHQLCCKPKIHSELIENLKDNLNEKVELIFMEVIDTVADRVTIGQKTLFKIKNEFLSQYSPFFYHYTQTDKNSSEQWVRKRLKELSHDEVLPPPVPILFSENFSQINDILRCDVFFSLLRTTLKFVFTKQNWWTETTLEIVLHLIGIALHEDWRCASSCSQNFPFLSALDRFESSVNHKTVLQCIKTSRWTIFGFLEHLPEVVDEEHVMLVRWTLHKWCTVKLFREQMNLKSLPKSPSGSVVSTAIGNNSRPCSASPIDEQKSVEHMEVTKPFDEEKRLRDAAAKARRAKVMAKMSQMQKKFIEKNVDLAAESKDAAANSGPSIENQTTAMEVDVHFDASSGILNKVVGSGRIVKRAQNETLICILCQEDVEENLSSRAMVMAAAGIRSGVLKWPLDTCSPDSATSDSDSVSGAASDPVDSYKDRPLIAKRDHPEGTFIAVCGHVMHLDCKRRYSKEMRNKVHGFHSFLAETEFRCPLCKCLSNIDLILLPPLNDLLPNDQLTNQLNVSISFDQWLFALTKWLAANHKEASLLGGNSQERSHIPSAFPELSALYCQSPTDYYGTNEPLADVDEGKSEAVVNMPTDLRKVGHAKSLDIDLTYNYSAVDHRTLRHSLAYTLAVWQKSLSLSGSSFFNGLAERYNNGLSYIIRACMMAHSSKNTLNCEDFSNETVRSDTVELLSVLLPPSFSIEESGKMDTSEEAQTGAFACDGASNVSILEVDCFFLLVSLVMMRPVIFSSEEDMKRYFGEESPSSPLCTLSRMACGDVVEQHCVRLCTAAHVVQSILLAQPDELSSWRGSAFSQNTTVFSRSLSEEEAMFESEEMVELYQQLRLASGINESFVPSPRALAHYLRDSLLPYLRCSAYFLYNISQVDPPLPLIQKDACLSVEREFFLLMKYLDIPLNICALLEKSGESLKNLFAKWCLDKQVETQLDNIAKNVAKHKERLANIESQFNSDSAPICDTLSLAIARGPQYARLIDLPHDYTDLLAKAVEYTCSGCDTSRYPAFCLICGEFACYQGYCCLVLEGPRNTNVFGAQIHARRRHSGYTVMLSLQKCKLLVYSDEARRMNTYPAPYKDRYGETDQGLRRGQPLYLDKEEYRKLNEQWLNHSLVHSASSAITDVLWE